MWQLRRLSTNEALSDAGPLPSDWGPICGLAGITEKLGDLSWLGPKHTDTGWIELTEDEQRAIREDEVRARVAAEKEVANAALAASDLTVAQKIIWDNFVMDLDKVCLCADFDCDPKIPKRPNA
jgi:hypothetical protein